MDNEEEQESETSTEVDTAYDFIDMLLQNSEANSLYSQTFMQSFVFYGKSLEQWSTELQILVPKEVTPNELQGLYIGLANSIQIAAHFKAAANAMHSALSTGIKIQRDDVIKQMVDNHLKANQSRPAAKVLEAMADATLKSTTLTKESARLVKEFWSQKYDSLIEVRKSLEQLNMSIITEHKYAGGNE